MMDGEPSSTTAIIGGGKENQKEEIAQNDNNNDRSDNGGKTDEDSITADQQQQQKDQEDLEMISAFIAEMTARFAAKREERQANDPKTIEYPDESFFGRLDSSIKKNTAFVKKLRNMTEAQRELILKDLASLNLSRYVSELASALVETKLKLTDIGLAVTVCSLLHRRYSEFSGQLLEAWAKALPRKPTDTFNAAKMRIDVRLFTELVLAGIFPPKEALSLLGSVLTVLTTGDREAHNNLAIVLGFCKQYANEFAGLVPRKMRLLAEAHNLTVPICDFLSAERQKAVRHLLKDEYFSSLVAHLHRDDKRLRGMEAEMRRVLVTRGEVAKHQKEAYETRSLEFKKLWATAEQLAEVLDEELPAFGREGDDLDEDQKGDVVFDFSNRFRGGDGSGCPQTALWEDEETRTFYENLPDLKSIIPAILYKDSLKDGQNASNISTTAESSSSATNSPESSLINGTATEGEITDEVNKSEEGAEKVDEVEKKVKEEEEMEVDEEDFADSGKDMANLNENDELEIALSAIEKTESKQKQKNGTAESFETGNEDAGKGGNQTSKGTSASTTTIPTSSTKSPIDVFFASLLKCVNRDFIDKAALTFATTYNTKTNRKKLVNVLFIVPRTRLDLLPFYARFVAQLNPIMPTVGADLVSLLKHNFRYLFKKKDQINIESKVKNIRFIGELVKFGVFPKPDALYILKTLLSDFRHHHIEMACNLLETAGQYLYRSPDSYPMTNHLLDQLMRHKARMALDSRYAIMVENAYYVVNPPEDKLLGRNVPSKPPMHLYIEHLIYTELSKATVSKVLIKIRKMNWADPETATFAIQSLASVWQLKYYNIVYLAHLLFGLYTYQEWVVPRVLDTVLEDIRLGMQMNAVVEWNQRRISVIRFFAECFNYRLIDSGLLFRVLYQLITYGVNYEDITLSPLDPPANLMRLRLVAQILHTTGSFLTSGLSRKKLDYYLYFYQRYYWLKKAYLNSLVAATAAAATSTSVSTTTTEAQNQQQTQQQTSNILVGGGGNTNSPDLNAQFYIDSIFKDVIIYLKPRFKIADSYETACRQLEAHLKEVAEKAKELMPNSSQLLSVEQVLKPSSFIVQQQSNKSGGGSRRGSGGGLEPIVEEADYEEDGSVALNGGDNDSQDGFDEDHRYNSDGEPDEEMDEEEEEDGVADEEDEEPEEDGTKKVKLTTKTPAIVQCTEDDEFQRDFERMLTESLTSRSQEVVRPNVEIVIPIERGGVEKKKTVVNSFTEEDGSQPFSMALNDRQSSSGSSNSSHQKETFQFRVMARNAKSNKPLFRSIEVSPESELVQNYLAREEELRAQKEAVKRVILDINQRRELEDFSSGSPSRGSTSTDGSSGGSGVGYSPRGGGGQQSQHYQQQNYHGGGHWSGGGSYNRQGGGGGSGYYHNSNNNHSNNSSNQKDGNNSGNQQNTINYQQYRRRFN